jgi:hypothetical protein
MGFPRPSIADGMRCAAHSLFDTLHFLLSHLHDVYINIFRWPVTIHTNEIQKPNYKNGDGNGWL